MEIVDDQFEFVDDRQNYQLEINNREASDDSGSMVLAGGINIIPDIETPQDEYRHIFDEFVLGSAIRERAFYRIWRLRKTGIWNQIISDNGQRYNIWEDFIKDIANNDALGIGRQIIFDRMKAYDQLEWLGYTHEDIIHKMSMRPSLYTRVLKRIIQWDSLDRKIISVAVPTADNSSEETMRDAVNGIIKDVEAFDKQIDAIRYVDENLLCAPRVEIYMEDDVIVLDYVRTSVTEDGEIVVDESGQIKFYPNEPVPDWVLGIASINIGAK